MSQRRPSLYPSCLAADCRALSLPSFHHRALLKEVAVTRSSSCPLSSSLFPCQIRVKGGCCRLLHVLSIGCRAFTTTVIPSSAVVEGGCHHPFLVLPASCRSLQSSPFSRRSRVEEGQGHHIWIWMWLANIKARVSSSRFYFSESQKFILLGTSHKYPNSKE